MEQLDDLLDTISIANVTRRRRMTTKSSVPKPPPPKSKYCSPREPDERRVRAGRRRFQVNELWEIHHEIVRRLVLGQKAKRIAEDLNVSPNMVSYTRNSPAVRHQIEIMRGARDADTIDLAKRIRDDAPEALKLLEDIISGEVDATIGLRAREANNMLNRAGYAPVQNIKGAFVHEHYSAEEIDAIKKHAIENGIKSGVVIDAEVEDVNNVINVTDAQDVDNVNNVGKEATG